MSELPEMYWLRHLCGGLSTGRNSIRSDGGETGAESGKANICGGYGGKCPTGGIHVFKCGYAD